MHLGHNAAAAKAASPSPNEPPTSQELNDRAERRATLALFAGIVALATVGVLVAVIANSVMGHRHHAAMMSTGANFAPAAKAPVAAVQPVSLSVVPGGKLGPKGERYDAFTKTDFAVKVGQPVKLTIDNRDDVIHSITSTAAGVGIAAMPGKHTYTLIVRKAGRFKWICAYPCDPYSMDSTGYMQGYITAT
jgi:heme/copper-type cytochrome/quinol oxidase subunit 2